MIKVKKMDSEKIGNEKGKEIEIEKEKWRLWTLEMEQIMKNA